MFNIGPVEMIVLGLVAVLVIGPDKLPRLARDAAHMLRGLREFATGARTQLEEEIGPELAELRGMSPRSLLRNALLGDADPGAGAAGLRADLAAVDPRRVVADELRDARTALRPQPATADLPTPRPLPHYAEPPPPAPARRRPSPRTR